MKYLTFPNENRRLEFLCVSSEKVRNIERPDRFSLNEIHLFMFDYVRIIDSADVHIAQGENKRKIFISGRLSKRRQKQSSEIDITSTSDRR